MGATHEQAAPKLGRPEGTGRPIGARDPGLAEKNQTLREHLAMPAEPAHPQRGNRFDAYYAQLSQLPAFKGKYRLKKWWQDTYRIVLTQAELDEAWKWLLPQ